MIRRFLAFTLLFWVTTSIYSQKDVTITVVQTSDLHGYLFPYDYINNTAIDYGLAQVFTYVKQLRNDSNNEVIFVDNGDILQGQPTVYYANYVDTTGQNIVSKIKN